MRGALVPGLRVLTAAALGVDASVHARDAGIYDTPHGGLLTVGNLFRAEAAVASLVALLVLLRPRRRVWLLALGVASSALGAVVLSRYVDVGAIGPIPNLYEPTWQIPGKLLSAYAEGAAAAFAGVGLWLSRRRTPSSTLRLLRPAALAAAPSSRRRHP